MNQLQSLLSAMTKREKFYFRKQYASSSSKNFYRLYDYLMSHNTASIDEVREHFKGSSIARNINYEQNQLFGKVMRVLSIYRMNSDSPKLQILNIIQYIEILIEKEQFGAIPKLLRKAKKIASENEEYSMLIKVIGIEEYLFFSHIDSDLVLNISMLEKERNTSVSRIQELNAHKLLKNRLMDFQFSTGLLTDDPEKYPDLFLNPLLDVNSELLSRRARSLWMCNRGMVNLLTGQYQEAKKYFSERVEFIKEHESLFSNQEYLSALNNYLFLLCCTLERKEFVVAHNKLIKYAEAGMRTAPWVRFISCYTRLAFYTGINEFSELPSLIAETSEYLSTHRGELNPTKIDELHFFMTNAQVAMGKYDLALETLNEWNQHPSDDYGFTRKKILWLITHLSLGHDKLLRNELSRFKIKVSRDNFFVRSLEVLVDSLKAILKRPGNLAALWTGLIAELEAEKKNYSVQPVIVEEFDLLKWARAIDPTKLLIGDKVE